MARAVNRLSARSVATLKEPGRHADGNGLYLIIDQAGAKRWVYIFQWRKERKEMGLGGVRDVSLADARDARDQARRQLRAGLNPIEVRKRAKADVSFRAVAEQLRTQLQPGWRNAKHGAQWINTLEQHAPKLMPMDVADVDVAAVLATLKPIWNTIPETAGRVRGRIEAVLDAARAEGLRSGENPARWRGHLDKLLPKRARLTRGHHKAMPYADVPAFMALLRAQSSESAAMLEFTILNAVRSGEARGATWQEIQGDVWIIPKGRMKGGLEHRVPLTAAALEVIRHRGLPEAPVFTKTGKPMSLMAMDMLLRRLEVPFTVHGFRSSFRDWAGDCTDFARDVAEAALAHRVGDDVEKAYRRSDALAKRRRLMEAWAAFCATPHPADQSPTEASPPE